MTSMAVVYSVVTYMRLKEEEKDYQCEDYLSKLEVNCSSNAACVDKTCRKLMAYWCFQVVDRCRFSRETVAVAMNMLDRFLASASGHHVLKNRHVFQLACMTCLYMAIKIYESEALSPKTIESLSQGKHSEKDIQTMEIDVLFAIRWKCHPPTALSFVQYLLEIHTPLSEEEQLQIYNMTKLQIEWTVIHYKYSIREKASTIALAALANVQELLLDMDDSTYFGYLSVIISKSDERVKSLRKQLQKELQLEFPRELAEMYERHSIKGGVSRSSKTQQKPSMQRRDSDSSSSSPRDVYSQSGRIQTRQFKM
mmetsp:Transcript_11702/g.17168  ORF Transcript_11702/g.17168 Transcript_11702/m.17168 type:complete len:310 (-) Transcript_11702:23-952(-)